MTPKQHEAATVIALKRGCGQAEADRTASTLSDEQCERIVAARDAFAGGQLVESILSEGQRQEAAVEPPGVDDEKGQDEEPDKPA